MQLSCPLVLASVSPRRRRLLEEIGFAFEVDPSNVPEHVDSRLKPGELAEELALEKARVVAARHPEALTLGADTLVLLDGEMLGKPVDADDAARMLQMLSGRVNVVHTGIALVHPPSGRTVVAHETTEVRFASLSGIEIDRYVASGAPMDKAGAYGIQGDLGAVFISEIRGDYFNVVGLPLRLLYQLLKNRFDDLFLL